MMITIGAEFLDKNKKIGPEDMANILEKMKSNGHYIESPAALAAEVRAAEQGMGVSQADEDGRFGDDWRSHRSG